MPMSRPRTSSGWSVADTANSSQPRADRWAWDDPLEHFLKHHDELLNKLFAYVSRRIPGSCDAKAVFWQVLEPFAAYLDRADCPPEAHPMILFGIAGKKVADYWRHEERRGKEVLTAPSELSLLDDHLSDPFVTAEMRIDLLRALGGLDADERTALVLCHVDQLDQESAARIMGVSRNQVRWVLRTAKKKLCESGALDGYIAGLPPAVPRRKRQGDSSEGAE